MTAQTAALAFALLCVGAGALPADPARAARPTISILDPRDVSLDYGRLVTAADATKSFRVAIRNDAERTQDIEVRVLDLVSSPGEEPLAGVFAENAVKGSVEAGAVATINYLVGAPAKAPNPGTYAGTLVAFGEMGGVERRTITLTVTAQADAAEPQPDPVAGLTVATLPPVRLPATNYWPTFLGMSAGWVVVLGLALALVALLGSQLSIPRVARVLIGVASLVMVSLLAPLAVDDGTEPVNQVEVKAAPVNPTIASGAVGTVTGDNGDVGTLVVTADSKLTAIGLHSAGTYKGTVDLNGAADEGAADATVNVRDWWVFAALFIAAGVAIGYWISKWFQKQRATNQVLVRIDDRWEEVAEDDSAFQQKAGGRPYGVYSLVPYAKARLTEATERLDEDPDDTKPATAILDRLEAQIARMGQLREALRVLDNSAVELASKVRTERFALGDAERVAALRDASELLTRGLHLSAEDADGAAIKDVEAEVVSASKNVDRVGELHDRIAAALFLAGRIRVNDPPPNAKQKADVDKHENALRDLGRAVLLTTDDGVLDEQEKAIAEPEKEIRDIWKEVVKPYQQGVRPALTAMTLAFRAESSIDLQSLTATAMEVTVIGPTSERAADYGDLDDLFEFRVTVTNPGEAVGVVWSFGDDSAPVEASANPGTNTLVARHQFAEAKSFTVSLNLDGQPLKDANANLVQLSVEVAGGKGRAARTRDAFRRLDARMTLTSGAIAVGSGMLALYFSDSGWGQPDDYLKALLWGSVVSEGLKYATALATHIWPSS